MALRALERLLLLTACLFGVAAPLLAETPEEIFARGNQAYADGEFREAVIAYESLLLYRVDDPRLEYNLAGALFRLDRLGESILHYERARRLAPNDPEIQDNLDYARSFCVDRIESEPVHATVAFVVRLQNGIGPSLHGAAFLVLWWLLVGVVVFAFSRRSGRRPWLGWLGAVLVTLLLVTGLSWYVTWDRLVATERAVVQSAAVEVLAGPGQNNATLFTVHEGLTVELRDTRDDWAQVSLPNGLSGWLPRTTIETVQP